MKLKYIALIVVIAVLVLAIGCGKKAEPAPEPAPVAPEPVAPEPIPAPVPVEETTEEFEDIVLEEGGDVTEEAVEAKEEAGLAADVVEGDAFPQATCELREVDGKEKRVLTVVVKNTAEDDWEIYGMGHVKGMVKIGNRGVIDVTPGCEKMELAPGESTKCTELDQGAPIEGENRVTVNTPGQQYVKIVMCP